MLAALALVAAACGPKYAPRRASAPHFEGIVLHRFDFEAGEAGPWTQLKLPTDASLRIVADPAGAEGRVARFELHRDDPDVSDGKRAELQIDDVGEIGGGRDWWYGFRTYLPDDWQADDENEILAQWKGKRDKDLGEESKSPALALRAREGTWYVTNRWDARAVTPENDSPNEKVWKGSLDVGKWTGWVVHARWSYGDDGLLEIWKDGRQIVEKHGPNTYNDRRGMYFKIGIYKAPWSDPGRSRVDRRVVYHDDVWIGVGG